MKKSDLLAKVFRPPDEKRPVSSGYDPHRADRAEKQWLAHRDFLEKACKNRMPIVVLYGRGKVAILQNPTASALAWRRRETEGIAIFVLCGRSEETEWILLFFIIAGGLTIPYIGW
ncbi:MAG: hypothetical protein Q4D77_02705 [Peptostreptococcaceae bacterium]|nr:hypothetical protein [Peptostreptococcaceae bacterium]